MKKFKDKNITRSLYLLLYVISWCDRINIYFRSNSIPTAQVEKNYMDIILMNENICRPKCITSKHIGNVKQKSADKCINEYKNERNFTL